MNTAPISQLLGRLWLHIRPRRRRQFGLLIVLMIFSSFAEIFSIGAVLPFLAALTSPERVLGHPAIQPVIRLLGITSANQLLLPLTVIFCIAAVVSALIRYLLLWSNYRVSWGIGSEFGNDIYRKTLYQPYAVHVARNSSEVINGIAVKSSNMISGVLRPIPILISSGIMLLAILTGLFFVNPIMACSTFGVFGIIYGALILFTRNKLQKNSKQIAKESSEVIKCLQEGLGGIRDILIDGSQSVYCNSYKKADASLRQAQSKNQFISESPRYGIDALGMLLMAGLGYFLVRQSGGITEAVPVLGAFALGAQRLMPVVQQGYAAWASITGSVETLRDTLELLDQPLPEYANQVVVTPCTFVDSIGLRDVSFRYTCDGKMILRNVDLRIQKGARVGLIGATGCGKSTLLDIVMGLLPPTDGCLVIDDEVIAPSNQRAWQAHIAHVPQTIFLADSTIEENIAFGQPRDQIDQMRVRQAASRAQIASSIESWSDGYQTLVGERGIRLSGGQRQRIGIARALYKRANVIVFDEATSALDNETEQAVMQAIEGLGEDLTIFMIAHRLTTLKNCTQIVELGEGGVRRIGSYDEIVAKLE